jgi:hypothetical protein
MHIPLEFQSILDQDGVSLKSEGVADIALPPGAARRALDVLRAAKIAVTGGEVWCRRGDRFTPTYDIWNVESADYSTVDEYVRDSLEVADKQVNKYMSLQEGFFIALGI